MSMPETFARTGFARFMNSPFGRLARIIVGLALVGWGYALSGGTTGIVLMIIGLVPLVAGLFDLCIISPLLGGPLSGDRLRKLSSRE